MARTGYDDVVLAVPVTIPYVRYSIRSAHWFLGRAMAELIAGCKNSEIAHRRSGGGEFHARPRHRGRPDATSRADVTLARPCADGRRVRHRLDPPRGAGGAERRRRDYRLHCWRYQSHRQLPPQYRFVQPVCPGCGLSVWLRRPQHELCVSHIVLHAHLRGEA